MRSKKQEEEMKVKILFLSKLFLESNYSDIELSNITGISSSSVGRYLTSNLAKEVLGSDIYTEISRKRQENLYNAKIKGGQNFIKQNVPFKDNEGKFIGSYKRWLKVLIYIFLFVIRFVHTVAFVKCLKMMRL